MKQYRFWILIVGLSGLAGTHCAAEPSDESAHPAAEAIAEYEQALANAPVSLADAIAAATAKYPDGKLDDAKFEADALVPVFEVDLRVGDTVLEGRIDPATGEVGAFGPDDDAAEDAEPGADGEGGEPSDRAGRVPCDRAIAAAEAAGGGRAVELEDDGTWFGIRVYGGGEFRDVDVDAQGRVGGIRHIEWGGRNRGPRPGHGDGAAGAGPGGPFQGEAGGDGAGPGGPWQGQGGGDGTGPRGPWEGQAGDGQGPRGGAHGFPRGDAGSNG